MKINIKSIQTVFNRRIAVINRSELLLSGKEHFPLSYTAGNTRVKQPNKNNIGFYLERGEYSGLRSEVRKTQIQQDIDKANKLWGKQCQKIAIIDSIQTVKEIDPIAVDKALKVVRFAFQIVENGIQKPTYKEIKEKRLQTV